jgi:hypothetical protein
MGVQGQALVNLHHKQQQQQQQEEEEGMEVVGMPHPTSLYLV